MGVSPGVRPEGRLRWFAHPLGGIVCRGPAFAPGSSKVTVGCCWFVFCFVFLNSLCIFCPEFVLTAHAHSSYF